MNSLLLTDFYKTSHKFMYPEGTEVVYSNLTARKSRRPGVNSVVFFGLRTLLEGAGDCCNTFRQKPDFCLEYADDSHKVTMFEI